MTTKLGNLGVELLGLAAAVQKLVEDGTTFSAVQLLGLAAAVQKLVEDATTFSAVQPGPDALLPPLTLAGTDTVPVRDGRFTLGGSATAQLQISVLRDPGSDQDAAQILQATPG